MALSDSFQSGVRIAKDWQENNRTREDRELITQMNRLKANDIIKGMEVDAEVKNFAKVSEFDAKDLDPNHPGYARQLMGIAKTRMRDLSPAAYEKARPMVAQFYDRFDARKQIEAEMDQRGTATDYTAMFGEAPAGISYQDSKFAMFAKDKFGVDPVFAEKDGIRIFDRKGTQAAVDVERTIQEKLAGTREGEKKEAALLVGIPRLNAEKEADAATAAALEESKYSLGIKREAVLYGLAQTREILKSETQFADTFSKEFSGATFAAPKSQLDRQALLEYKVALPGEEMPMSGSSPNYPEMRKLITKKLNADKVAFAKSMADANKPPVKAETPPDVAQYAKDSGASTRTSQEYSAKLSGYLKIFNDPKVDMEEKISTARTIMKLFNSALVGSPDAVAAQEAKFLGDELEFKKFNVAGFFDQSQQVIGQNFPLFIKKVSTMKTILDSSAERSRVAGAWAKKENEIPSANDLKIATGEPPEFQNEREHEVWKATPRGGAYGGSIVIGGKRYNPKRTGTTGPAPTDPAPQGVTPATPRAALPTQDQRRAGQIEQVRKDIAELKSKVPPPGVRDWDGKRPALLAQIKAQENLLSDLLSK